MKIRLARTAGFCMGVRRAMEMALEALHQRKGPIYSLGPLIHNAQAMEMLSHKGLKVVESLDGFKEGPGSVIIRAHGVPPQQAARLRELGLTVLDATCPRVLKVQAIIKKYAAQGYTTIIVGDADHPEVVGLMGCAQGRGLAVAGPGDLGRLDQAERLIVVAQTTQSPELFERVVQAVKTRWPQALVFSTICHATQRRQEETRRLAASVDAMIVVGGKNSGNTKRLAEVAAATGVKTIHVESEEEIDPQWLDNVARVGVTAGASTPNWMIKRVIRALTRLARRQPPNFRTMGYRLLRMALLGNAYIALGGAFLYLASSWLQSTPASWPMFALTFFYVHAMHMLNLFMDKEAGRYNDPDRALFLEEHHEFLTFSALLSGALAVGLSTVMGPGIFLLVVSTALVGLVYSLEVFSGLLKPLLGIRRLKDIPASKTLMISGGWAISLSLIPALGPGGRFSTATLAAGLIIFLMVFVRSALGDIFEIQGDRIVGRETIPILIGESRTLTLLNLVLSLLILLIVSAGLGGMAQAAWFLTIPVLYSWFCLVLYRRRRFVIGVYFEALVDASFIIAGLSMLLWRLLERLG